MASENKNLNLAKTRIENSKLNLENKDILRDYMVACSIGENIAKKSLRTINGEIIVLCNFFEYINKPIRDVLKIDITSYLFYLTDEKKLSDSTCILYRLHIKGFFSWLDEGQHREKVEWIKGGKTSKRKLDETKLLMPSEINKMIRTADRYREKAMLMGLWESATRISEFTGIKIKDIIFDDYGCKIKVDGKTGERTIRLIDSTPYFLKWLEEHPFKDNPESPFWISYATNHYGKQLDERTFRKKITCIAKRSGLKKHVFPHLFRHSRLTWLAQNENFNEVHLRVFAGWSPTSEMAHKYTHITENDVDKKLRASRGLINNEETYSQKLERETLNFRICSRCGTKHSNDTLYCNCGMCLNPIESTNIDKTKEQAINEALGELINIMKDPTRMQEFEKFKNNII